jgi:lysophospholipid acyltransferase (LPLAT)-like uncharacterized protein
MKLRSRWLIHVAAFAIALFLRAWMKTVRVRVVSFDERPHPADPSQRRFIYGLWHESVLTATQYGANVRVLISQSADGELIARVCQHLGIGTARGSATRGGAKGLLEMLRAREGAHLVLTPDGPRGPRRRLKPGIVFLASHAGLPVVPVGVGFTRAWRAPSWDHFAVPLPFSTVTGVIGAPIDVPPELAREEIEPYRLRVENAMIEAAEAAERWAFDRSQPPVVPAHGNPRSGERIPLEQPVIQ